ncbi:MAG: hypothetical protein A3H57_03940 [Candidatus Taylorbacteria bacterium RIFCSPLOWO2_02_FULL_43_11]|uniref:DNA 3'-5' helicase n=1 Tax=Candidatus Taylorbacteria bacterium RIFCSPHIGHO2_02_FULL_43_32b TaxID=1802306 RepID=A0A1G2MLH4_9BACT|nr:MAG: hypothetical protein A2743_01420 [Candidatus Taylorbacteria bacterium RIFCSPHIGHO2_01_FULL_43_47]OHA24049.1 MAG: hypothetical protein A3C72_02850 [Candidatus Taylorbacteria bacterium RIFCSPHIGHO2_02_FULL_43_32b]OHA31487.1 MAG: hypothetical protein A3B08_00895 [Candidatus Taylorbacteria bacterium RIFCSPLOWO2_01_FULL_43_44]OHA37539.1 MAG: hypothetical protein A3H57_03940 [Candidatus Taylorbacteria bacterium RIFCSPLOWO2_02_FULL_43_11]
MSNYLDSLNPAQREAALHTEGPVLIIAGAGAGKTKTVTHRIIHLIKNGANPGSILAITFTNKAAREMRERVISMLREDKELNRPISISLYGENSPFLGTFHSLGVKILRENFKSAGISASFAIFDRGDCVRSIKDAMKRRGIDPKSFEPGKILSAISREKGNMLTAEEFAKGVERSYFRQLVASIWIEYEKILKEENALDFDDLLLRPTLLLKKNEEVRNAYQEKWKYIHVDEYQDTNAVQYQLVKLISLKHRNVCVVGDIDQCVPPETRVMTPKSEVPIKNVRPGDIILSASGQGTTCPSVVTRVIKRKFRGKLVKIITENGHTIKTTDKHIMFAKLPDLAENFFVYLMYRRDKGFRIGIAKTTRKNGVGIDVCGLSVRSNQEKADKMWILKICSTKKQAIFWENYYSAEYGLPTVVFHSVGRNIILDQNDINNLFMTISTSERAKKLFRETGLSVDFPHYIPQGTTKTNTERERLNVRLCMFSDKRKSILHPWGLSRASINTTSLSLNKSLRLANMPTRKGKRNDWRLEVARLDYADAEKLAMKILDLQPNLTIVRTAHLTKESAMMLQPATNLFPGMKLATLRNGKILEETIKSVDRETFNGFVYDLDVENVHNYIANKIAVHNSIYSWRGADIKNILDFEKDYPEAKVVLLEQNYRSTQTILTVANRIIAKNKMRREKNLFTKNTEGERIGLYTSYDEADEGEFVASKTKELIDAGVKPSEIAVLYRANFQSRVLEESFMNKNLPYQVLGTKFFERKEIKDAISYVRSAINPEGFADWQRIIAAPPRGIGKVTLAKVVSGQGGTLPPAAKAKIQELRNLLAEIKNKISTGKLSETVKFTVTNSGLLDYLKSDGLEGEERVENLKELITFSSRYDTEEGEKAVEHFLTDVALASDQDEMEEKREAVRLMTVHASKGLEFDVVFITGLEEDLFPHKKMSENEVTDSEAEEERRLFYVALTRARKKVYLSYASVRTIFGSKQVNVPSEFIFDIDEEYIANEERLSGGGRIIYLD